ncbi:Homeobox protein Nkx-3.2, partial [Eschrichtius robustus]|nr:Homeobox protein Nkx-3.2 [Eschrichtius robustus]
MAVRGANTLTPFSIQAILNKKEERGGLPATEGRPVPGGTAVAAAPAVCCWRLFGETDAGALGGAEDSLLASPPGTRTAAGRTTESPGGWDSDSALSEENEGGRRCADPPGASGACRAGATLGLGQPVCELPAAKDLEEEAAGRSDSEMSASVSGRLRLRGEGGRAEGLGKESNYAEWGGPAVSTLFPGPPGLAKTLSSAHRRGLL